MKPNFLSQMSVYYYIMLIFIMAGQTAGSQTPIILPTKITIVLDGNKWDYPSAWLDSLNQNAFTEHTRYILGGGIFSEKMSITLLEIPQTLTVHQVLQQVIYYYCTLDEKVSQTESVRVFPFFCADKTNPFIKARYSGNGIFHFSIRDWQTIPFPEKPTDMEISIYNQILNDIFTDHGNFNQVSEKYYQKIAAEHNLSPKQVQKIFKKVTFWKTK